LSHSHNSVENPNGTIVQRELGISQAEAQDAAFAQEHSPQQGRICTGSQSRREACTLPHFNTAYLLFNSSLYQVKLASYMEFTKRFDLDAWFQRQCDLGRKFVSGVCSIFVLTYAGSVTAGAESHVLLPCLSI